MRVTSLDHLVLTVRDIEQSAAFYVDALGMRHRVFTATDGTRRHALSFGTQKINLHQAGAEFEPNAAAPTPGSGDLCFLVDGTIADWQAHFAAGDVPVVAGPVPRTGATGPILSLYIRDPDGTLVEVSVPV